MSSLLVPGLIVVLLWVSHSMPHVHSPQARARRAKRANFSSPSATPVRPPRRFECGPTEYFIGDSDNEHINDKELPSVPDFPFGKSAAAAAALRSSLAHSLPRSLSGPYRSLTRSLTSSLPFSLQV